MKSIMVTRCGCERTMDITYPPPPTIEIPLNRREPDRGFLVMSPEDPSSPNPMMTRQFRKRPSAIYPREVAYYYEEQ